jgi:hypothetical protein
MTRLANTGPTVLFNLLQQLQALGLDLPSVLQQLGIDYKNGAGETKPVETKSSSKRGE